MDLPDRIICPEIERAKIYRIQSFVINSMKCNTNKALLENILPPDIQLNRTI
jgi:hypothetical protein